MKISLQGREADDLNELSRCVVTLNIICIFLELCNLLEFHYNCIHFCDVDLYSFVFLYNLIREKKRKKPSELISTKTKLADKKEIQIQG